MSNLSVGIIWRNDGEGKGAFWDHFTLQKILKQRTVIIPFDNVDPIRLQDIFYQHVIKLPISNYTRTYLEKDKSLNDLKDICKQLNQQTSGNRNVLIDRILTGPPKLLFGEDKNGYRVPSFVDNPENVDIIVIAGVSRDSDEADRRRFEIEILQNYQGRKPILLLCGGVWRLEALGFGLQVAELHCYSKMVNLNSHGKVEENTAIHYVEVQDNETSRKIFGEDLPEKFEVNSVHSEAISNLGPTYENDFHIIAYSEDPVLMDDGSVRKNRSKQEMRSVRCIEAICSKSGPPIVAIQWHPEAYCDYPSPNPHETLLKYPLSYLLSEDIEGGLIPINKVVI